ncbi:MAG: TRAP transporter small permease subunit [Deltaproteobacteria bacterium]|nr:TRAP transporter small permease subunit [Deltaproteobacteria bacterium]
MAQLRRGFYWTYERIRDLNRLLIWVAAIGIVIINLLTLIEVFTRYILRNPATWTLPLSSYLLLYVIYLATAYTLERGGHVGMEFVVEMLPASWRARCARLGDFLGLAFVLLFFWETCRITQRAIVERQRDISTLSAPLSVTTIILPVGLGLMALTYVCMIIDGFLRPGLSKAAPGQPLDSAE